MPAHMPTMSCGPVDSSHPWAAPCHTPTNMCPVLQSSPNDFRAYLAKGLLLKDQGRAGDAERYFIQVR